MELSLIIPHVEVLIFSSDRPLTTLELTDMVNNALGFIEDRATLDQVEAAVQAIREKYASEFYPFEVRESGGGYQFLTKKEYYKTVAQINGDKFLKRLSTAALETLAIIAYKQPITKAEIESIRGVSCDYTIQKLLEKELIVITGRNENLPGHPLVYGTSRSFMDYFGINSPDDLPKIKEVMPADMVNPTGVMSDTLHVAGDEAQELPSESQVLVTPNGELVEQPLTAGEQTAVNGFVQPENENREETVKHTAPDAHEDLPSATTEDTKGENNDEQDRPQPE